MNTENSTNKIFKKVFFNDKYLEIKGGKLLEGKIKISGAKNSALVLMAASILSRGQINLFNVPKISDVLIMSKILSGMGINIKSNENELKINTREISPPSQNLFFDFLILSELVSFASVHSLVDLERLNTFPGGCLIGSRPIDEHINSLKKLGEISIKR